MLKLHKSFKGESPAGHNFEVAGHFSFGSSKSTIDFKNQADGAAIELHLKGDVSRYGKFLSASRTDRTCSGLIARRASSLATALLRTSLAS